MAKRPLSECEDCCRGALLSLVRAVVPEAGGRRDPLLQIVDDEIEDLVGDSDDLVCRVAIVPQVKDEASDGAPAVTPESTDIASGMWFQGKALKSIAGSMD
ncbi:hypothetical protein [Archangium lipolyticum]|uniref:hypothetical protein n=1 Tax=Archangium lipolyticum TaxID=2970465 RepID=UPI00214A5C0C|nr:hypothetical protein [Archangium lipolyticum]